MSEPKVGRPTGRPAPDTTEAAEQAARRSAPSPGRAEEPRDHSAEDDLLDRPVTVTAAAVITWICTGFTSLATVIVMLPAVMDNDHFFATMMHPGDTWTQADYRAAVIIGCALILLWCSAAAVLAWFMIRRRKWARIALAFSAAVVVLVSLAGILSIVAAGPLVGAFAVLVLIFRRSANTWFSAVPAAPVGPAAPAR